MDLSLVFSATFYNGKKTNKPKHPPDTKSTTLFMEEGKMTGSLVIITHYYYNMLKTCHQRNWKLSAARTNKLFFFFESSKGIPFRIRSCSDVSTNSSFLSCLFEEEDYSAACYCFQSAEIINTEGLRALQVQHKQQLQLWQKKVCVKMNSKFRSSWLNLFRYCLSSRGI